jgi:pimeloyl-ACP methyl ester carboxylesterase
VRTLLKIAKYSSIVAIGLLTFAIAALLSLRAYNQSANAPKFAIQSANGIDEGGYVKIGGIEQWVQIRGQDRDNPVLLCVHGGPGGTWIPLTANFIPWEKHFTVVLWDQRGAGKTLSATGASIAETMSVDRMAQDGIEVAEYLRTHLRKDKVILLSHSWGSILGINMIKRRPDLFFAYVGTGQASDMPKSIAMAYAHVLEQARAADDKGTLQLLTQIGQPPFDSKERIGGFFSSMDKYPTASDRAAMKTIGGKLTAPKPDYSLRDEFDRFRGFMVVPTLQVYSEMLGTRLKSLGPDFQIPIFFIQGSEDNLTQPSLAEDFLKTINAPHKEMVLLKGGGHFAFLSMADKFLEELIIRVRPWAKKQ